MNNPKLPWERRQPWFVLGAIVLTMVAAYPYFSPGFSVRSAPSVSPVKFAAGKELFLREWSINDPIAEGDGLGPVFNGTSCAECHSLGGLGGGGGLKHNVKTFEVVATRVDKNFHNGQVHSRAVTVGLKESEEKLRKLHPIVPGGLVSSIRDGAKKDFDPVGVVSTNSTAIFGAGWIDRIPTQAIRFQANNQAYEATRRELTGDFAGVSQGRMRVLADGRIGRFGWKAQFATLEDFVAAACSNEIGLGTPVRAQATPIGETPKKITPDLNAQKFESLVAFVEGLPRPAAIEPRDPAERRAALRGKELFNSIGCSCCHTESLGGVGGLYSDLLLHTIEDPILVPIGYYDVANLETPLPPDHPKPEEWRTAPLWGVADSAPYFHDGASPTLHDAILRHRGAATNVMQKYRNLGSGADDIVAFLRTLKAPADAEPVSVTPAKIAQK